jgi:LuxR family transcriptional regulator, maltose regulon positive regulatory protein
MDSLQLMAHLDPTLMSLSSPHPTPLEMSQSRLIQTKLHPPRVRAPLVERSRLSERLEGHGGRFFLVSAPAGFGKTVLVADWFSGQQVPRAWLSLDELDNDPSRFCAHLAAAVASLQVEGASKAAALIQGLGPPDLSLPPAFLPAFLDLGPDPILVLDDLHELDSPQVLGVVEELVRMEGPAPRLVLLTREDPPFPIGRLRLAGELLEIRARDLRFTEEETLRLFQRLMPGALEPDQIRRLDERTEGWVAGLRLAAIALQDATDPHALVESFAGQHRLVMEYLLEEALERQTPALQQFLLDTSILRRFNPGTCATVTGDPQAREKLREVERANLFLIPLGVQGEWYRYHHLFADLLRFKLEHQQGERVEELHRRASAWFHEEGDLASALEHAARMKDQTRLLELLDREVLGMIGRSEMAALRQWTGKVRDPFAQPYPMMICSIGWLRVITDRAPELEPILNAVSRAMDRVPATYDADRKRRVALHMAVLSAYAARYARRYEDALRIAEEIRESLADADPFTRGLLNYNTARVRMALGDMEAAAELLNQAFDDHLRSGNLYLTLASLGRTAAVVSQMEGVPPATESLAAARSFAEDQNLTQNPTFSIVLFHQGSVEFLAHRLDQARTSFESALDLASSKDFPEERGNALGGLARVAMAQGRVQEAEALLVEATSLSQGSNMDLLDTTLELERKRLALAREATGEGPPVPPIMVGPREGPWHTTRETEIVLALQHAFRHERNVLAEELSRELHHESEGRGRGPAWCWALLARALLSEGESRWKTLDQALNLAATQGYVRPFLDGGAPVRDLLRAGLTRLPASMGRAHARYLLDLMAGGPRSEKGDGGLGLLEPLTDREREVLALLFQGKGNKAIARAIFVSVDTVKTHLKHIYDKLGVSDRNAAVRRAEELGFDPEESG